MRRLGVERFLGALRLAGAESLRPEPGHYGLSAAVGALEVTPLEFDLLEAVGPRGHASVKEDTAPPAELTRVEVCAYSGRQPTEACTERREVYARRTAVPMQPCAYHQRVEVDVKTGLAVSPVCRAGREVESRVYLTWPASVRRWLTEQHRSLPAPPAHAPGCEPGGAGHAPEILSPAEGQVALLIPGVPADQQEVPLEAEAANERELTWFVNGKFLGRGRADERLWWTPAVGTHEILVTDDRGLTSRRVLVVRARP